MSADWGRKLFAAQMSEVLFSEKMKVTEKNRTCRWYLQSSKIGFVKYLGWDSLSFYRCAKLRSGRLRRLSPNHLAKPGKNPGRLTASTHFPAKPRDDLRILLNTAVQPATTSQLERAHGSTALCHELINDLYLPAGVTLYKCLKK